jgi:hypothetical protein
VFSSPWKKKFFSLLGQERSLDDIEHGLIRAPGAFDDPRIHVGVVCASIGCPMLRPEAFTPEKLDAQLDDGMKRFLADGTRNRYDAASGRLHVSKIFDWYGKDFEKGHKGYDSLKTTFARHAAQLAATPEAQAKVRSGDYKLDFLDYDWKLNDSRRRAAEAMPCLAAPQGRRAGLAGAPAAPAWRCCRCRRRAGPGRPLRRRHGVIPGALAHRAAEPDVPATRYRARTGTASMPWKPMPTTAWRCWRAR